VVWGVGCADVCGSPSEGAVGSFNSSEIVNRVHIAMMAQRAISGFFMLILSVQLVFMCIGFRGTEACQYALLDSTVSS
jgi:hypothetical protein